MDKDKEWGVKDSAALYNLRGWGLGYFGISDEGRATFRPGRSRKNPIDIKTVVDDVVARGVQLPVLFRFQDIVRDRVLQLNRAFQRAIDEHKYAGRYRGVYPIKVNQLREVVEEIQDAGAPHGMGLEAGSKAELMAVLAMNGPEGLTVVNGYKDASIMRLACVGLKIGKTVIVVIEKLSELELLLSVAEEIGVRPLVGLRCKLQTEGSGRWSSSAGHGAKFGLTTPEILAAVRMLEGRGLVDCIKLVHFHIGSQVTDISTIKNAVREGARFYAKLKKMAPALEYLDCGGGLGVDYEGANTTSDHSVNYTLGEYCRDVVYSIQEVCGQEKVPEPHIVTESGRALVAPHSVLVVDIFGSIETGSTPIPLELSSGEHGVVKEMHDVVAGTTLENLTESLHDGQQRLEEANSLFKLGYLGLEDKAKVETLFWRLLMEIRKLLPEGEQVPDELEKLLKSLDDQYLVNFSVFQSLPDSWAIDHIFPVMPLNRLQERPQRRAALVDITCDSDGKLEHFVCGRKKELQNTLPLHKLNGEPYYLGIFLVGAYQATMGDIHNLFGRVNEVHVFEDEQEPGGYYVEEIIRGQSVREVLTSIQYSEFELVKQIKSVVDAQVKAGKLKPREGVDLLDLYEHMMGDYTYIEHKAKAAATAPAVPAETEPRPQDEPVAG